MQRRFGYFLVNLTVTILVACAPQEPTGAAPITPDSVGDSAETIPAATPTEYPYGDLEIVTLLPRDGIPAIDNPKFLTVAEAEGRYQPDEMVIGVEFDGDARAYSVPFLSGHEIVNDTVGGRKIAVTW